MEKLVYLLWTGPEETSTTIAARLLAESAPRLLELEPRALSMNLDDADAEVPAPVPWPEGEPRLAATVSVWLDCYDRRDAFEEVLAPAARRRAGYLVSESLYSDYGTNGHAPPRDWPDGKRSPGITTVTVMERPDRMPRADWIQHWHGTQSPVSEAMQPRCRYVRNLVAHRLDAGAPGYEGIVEEVWPTVEHLTDPSLFYGAGDSAERLMDNQRRMFESVRAFLDFDRIRVATMSEYLLKSLPV